MTVENRIHSPARSLPKYELFIYSLVTFSAISYGLWNIASVSRYIRSNPKTFLPDGRFLTSGRDVNDHEWQSLERVMYIHMPCLFANACLTWFLSRFGLIKYRKWTAVFMGVTTLLLLSGIQNVAMIVAYATVTYIGMRFIHPWAFPWIIGIYMMFYPQGFYKTDKFLPVSVYAANFAFWHLTWNVMRFISFGSEWCWAKQARPGSLSNNSQSSFSYVNFLAFLCYAPTLYGPLLSYPSFYKQVICSEPEPSNNEVEDGIKISPINLKKFLKKAFELVLWFIGVSLAKELFYIHVIIEDLSLVKMMNGWGAGVFIWAHGQYFQAKYMVLYGWPSLAAYLDYGVKLLPLPLFISRVYLYSTMWKHFDCGLYDFIKRYIYVPLGGSRDRFISTSGVFLFIFTWHGLTRAIAIWSILNFAQIVGEIYIRKQVKDPKSFLSRHFYSKLSPTAQRRVAAFVCATSLLISAVGISLFLMGEHVGMLVSRWVIVNLRENLLVTALVCYSAVQLIMEWEYKEESSKLLNKESSSKTN